LHTEVKKIVPRKLHETFARRDLGITTVPYVALLLLMPVGRFLSVREKPAATDR
jgi:hypothetical protein